MSARVGVLALQGDFAAHAAAFARAGRDARPVRRCAELQGLDGLVLPGGESTTLLRLMEDEPWLEALQRFHAEGGALFGTCAGAILLACAVRPAQTSLGLLDVEVARNAWGRQIDSFAAPLESGLAQPLEGVFIRAPRFTSVGPRVEVLATLRGEPVMVRQGRVVAAAFHPELTGDGRLHAWFAELAAQSRAAA